MDSPPRASTDLCRFILESTRAARTIATLSSPLGKVRLELTEGYGSQITNVHTESSHQSISNKSMALSGRELSKDLSAASPHSGLSKVPGHKHGRPAAVRRTFLTLESFSDSPHRVIPNALKTTSKLRKTMENRRLLVGWEGDQGAPWRDSTQVQSLGRCTSPPG